MNDTTIFLTSIWRDVRPTGRDKSLGDMIPSGEIFERVKQTLHEQDWL